MLTVLSPAKTLDFDADPPAVARSQPRLIHRTETLVDTLKGYSPSRLAELMSISDKLATLNHGRFQDFEIPHPPRGTMPAVFAFRGDVYRGLSADDWTPKQIDVADQSLRILSGLYGVLRPLDAILPYRLEMGTALPVETFKQLYEFWGNDIQSVIRSDMTASKSKILLNLASNEYFKSVRATELDVPIIAPAFKELRDGVPKMITIYAKIARGTMASWVIRNRVRTLAKLKTFAEDGYQYSAKHSTDTVPVFVRHPK